MNNYNYNLCYVNDDKIIINKNWWDDPWTINEELILVENDNVVDKITLKEKEFILRGSLGIFYENETLIYIYFGYSNDPLLKLNFYKISSDNKLNKIKEETIKLNCSCGQCEGKSYKFTNGLFTVIWGDLTNYEYYNELIFNETSILSLNKKNINEDFSFNQYKLSYN